MFSSQNLGKYDGCVCATFIPKVFETNVNWAYKADCYIRDSKYLVTYFFRLLTNSKFYLVCFFEIGLFF